MSFPLVSVSLSGDFSTPEWSLRGHGHVIAASIIRGQPKIEARILLDGQPIYRSLHETPAAAAAELVALRGHWAREGWHEEG